MVRWHLVMAAGTATMILALAMGQQPQSPPPTAGLPIWSAASPLRSPPSETPNTFTPPPRSVVSSPGSVISPPGVSGTTATMPPTTVTVSSQRVPLKVADLTLKRLVTGADSASWQIWSGHRLFRDFADDEESARAVLTTLRDQRPEEWFLLGSPHPLVEYGLINGQPPLMLGRMGRGEPRLGGPSTSLQSNTYRPLMSGAGLHIILPIDLRTIRLEQIHGVWVLRDDHNLLINFADQQAAGEQALAAIRRHGLNRLGIVGRHRPAFRCLFAAIDEGREVLPEPLRRQHLQLQTEALNPIGLAVPGLGYVGLLHRFDPRRLSLRKQGGQWQIVTADDHVLGQFGPAESHAVDALRLLRDGQFTAIARYGPATLLFRQDQIAQRLPLHTHVRVFDPHSLRVVTADQRCFVADQGRPVCDCRDAAEGQTIIAILQAFGCNLLAHIGPTPRQGLTFFAHHP